MQPSSLENPTILTDAQGRIYRCLRGIAPVRKLVQTVRNILGRCRVPTWYLEGVGRVDGLRVSIVFAGHLESKNYFAHLALDQEHSERFLGARWIWNVWREGVASRADLIITQEWSGAFGLRDRGHSFRVPCWIGTEVDLEEAMSTAHASESIKSDVRRANRNGFTYTVTNEPAAIAAFYSTMYVPYVERAHGTRTMLTSWEEFSLELDRAELMLLHTNGETIAGNLFVDLGGRRARGRAMGVKNGDYAYAKMGAVAALYYFVIRHLKEKGCERLHYGASRPFLKDGVLGFKRKYGAQIVDKDWRIFHIRVARYSDGVKAFLRNNPFISESHGCFHANFFVNREAEIEENNLKSEIARYKVSGITATRIHNMEKASSALDAGRPPAEPTLIEIDNDVPYSKLPN